MDGRAWTCCRQMACKRPGVRVPLAPRFCSSEAYCDLEKPPWSACNSASCPSWAPCLAKIYAGQKDAARLHRCLRLPGSQTSSQSGSQWAPAGTAPVILEALILGGCRVMPAQRKYPEELRERVVRWCARSVRGTGRAGEIARVGRQLGIHPEALRGCPAGGNRRRDPAGHYDGGFPADRQARQAV